MSNQEDKTLFLMWLREKGLLTKLYQYGIITPTIFKMLEARLKIRDLMMQGVTKAEAVKRTAKALGIHEKHCYTYLR